MGFVAFPTQWIRDKGLAGVRLPDGVLELKTLIALALAKGQYQRRLLALKESFPASLDTLSDLAHVSRPQVVKGLALLRKRGLVARADSAWQEAGVGPRTAFYSFSQPAVPFFKLPVENVLASGLLQHLRVRNRISLAALKTYLLLGTFRDGKSGVSRLGYDAMTRYGVRRDAIRPGIDFLLNVGLISVARHEERTFANTYRLLGVIERRKRSTRSR